MMAVRETLPGGSVLTRKGLTQFVLTLPKSRSAVLFEKARTIVLKFDDESSKKLHKAFQDTDEHALTDCGQWIQHAVESYFRAHPSALPVEEVLHIGLFPEEQIYHRA